jgi:hypothetical protein
MSVLLSSNLKRLENERVYIFWEAAADHRERGQASVREARQREQPERHRYLE